MITGRIHSFETFGTLDGPGIRFVVFLQGCPLRCIYCHNRDTRDPADGKEYTVEQVMEELKKYLNYIKFSGGGITVSGGEPTLQADFVTELFRSCRGLGIHTVLDTSGFADVSAVRELLKYTDLVLLDVKHADEKKHTTITGVNNSKIVQFSKYTSELGIPIWIRYVLLPGFTDSEEDLQKAACFISGLSAVEKVEVLPYHTMGAFKWDKSGEKYPLEGVPEPTAEQVRRAEEILKA